MELDMINIAVVGALHFTATAPCGRAWSGMRHSGDVQIVIDRAMDHPKSCAECAKKRETMPVPRKNSTGSIEAR